jgi:hypothetical protein
VRAARGAATTDGAGGAQPRRAASHTALAAAAPRRRCSADERRSSPPHTMDLSAVVAAVNAATAAPPRSSGVPRASGALESAADRLLHAPAVDDAGWASFRGGSGSGGGSGALALSEELAVATTQRALAHDAELRVLEWCLYLLRDDRYGGESDGDELGGFGGALGGGIGGGAGAAAAAAEARAFGVRLARVLLTRVRWAEAAAGAAGGGGGGGGSREVCAVPQAAPGVVAAAAPPSSPAAPNAAARRVAAALAPLLDAFTRHLAAAAAAAAPHSAPAAAARDAERAVSGITRAIDAALALNADVHGGAAARAPVAGLHAHPLAAQLWALVPSPEDAAALPSGGAGAGAAANAALADAAAAASSAPPGVRSALATVRLLNRLLLAQPDATSALAEEAPPARSNANDAAAPRMMGALPKLRAWLGGGAAAGASPLLRAAVVDLLCTLFKRAPGGVLRALQAAGLGAAAAAAAAPPPPPHDEATPSLLVPRVAALVAVGALRERAEFAPGAWWADVAPPLRRCAADILDALSDGNSRKELLSHFHTSPGGPPARAAALCAAVAGGDGACVVLCAARLLLATAPERLCGGSAREAERTALLAAPGLAPALLHLGTHPADALLRRLGAALLGHLAAAQAGAGEPTLLASLCAAARSVEAMAPTVILRLLPEEGTADAANAAAHAAACAAAAASAAAAAAAAAASPGAAPDASSPPVNAPAAEMEVYPVDIPANKELLAARCPVFAAMFGNARCSEASAATVALRGVPPRGMRALLHWAATGGVRACADMEEALDGLSVAERFMVPELASEFTRIVKGTISEKNVGSLLRFSDAAGREALCAWACEWAVAGAHAGALVRAGTLAGLPGGAAHALMLAIAAKADAASAAPAAEGEGGKRKREKEADM